MTRLRILALLLVILYLAFFAWYTSLRGPLDSEEIEHYMALFAERGGDPAAQQRLRRFLERDTGDDFVMLNSIEFRDTPLQVEGVEPDHSAAEVLARYMEYMWPALLRRACHPVLVGTAAAGALDVWGLDGASEWSQGAGMRYRSRRDMMEIATNPAFAGRHEFKLAAMATTLAFPLDPWFQLGDPRLILGLVLVILLLLVRLSSRDQPTKLRLAGRLR